ncbi:MAG: damage-inducible protein DinB [Rhodospirillaceae bacterium]|nr:damage-inducible protein DinB [Rhodospirillaceae bacterium]
MTPYPTLAGFNQWATGHIYDCVAGLPDDAYRQDRKAFFGSIHATLNHLLLVDRLWMGRIIGKPVNISGLDDILYTGFQELRDAQRDENKALIDLVGGFSEDDLQSRISYQTSEGIPGERAIWLILTTLFNHQTHHRGQIHTMLTQAGITPPPLDIIYYAMDIGME